jgi:hypothetical protein
MKEGDVQRALDLYTQAAAADQTSVLAHSNRAIVLIRLGRFREAVEAADAAVALDPARAKSHASRSIALERMGRLDEAEASYARTLELDPQSVNARDNLRDLRQRRQAAEQARVAPAAAGGAGGGGSGAPASSASSSAAVTAALAGLPRMNPPPPSSLALFPAAGGAPAAAAGAAGFGGPAVQSLILLGRVAMIFLAIAYLLPLSAASSLAYTAFLGVSLVVHAAVVLNKHGRPRYDQAYAQQVLMDPTLPALFLPVVFFTTRPLAVALPAIGLVDSYLAGEWLAAVAERSLPMTKALLGATETRLSTFVLRLPPAVISTMRVPDYRSAVFTRLLYVESLCEVGVALLLLVELAFPHRAVMTTMLLWQGLQHKYVVSPFTKAAFRATDARIVALTSHRLCPAVVGTAYGTVARFLKGRVAPLEAAARGETPPQAAGGAGGIAGMLQSCSVM